MTPRFQYELPPDKQDILRQAAKLEWISVGVLLSITAGMIVTMGSSQAMKTALAENILGLTPPIAFLVSLRFRQRKPTEQYPYGYHRATNVAFLCGALALFAFGALLFLEAADKLIAQERPTVGMTPLFGHPIWKGWLMIAMLVYSAVLPGLLGRKKLPLADELHDKALHTDAAMNRADWMSDSAAILGVLGIGMGWWWADSLAAGLISLDVCREGWSNLKASVGDLMDSRPITVKEEADDLPDRVRDELLRLDWVRDAAVRMREEGNVYCGEAFVVPQDVHADRNALVDNLEDARRRVHALDWQMYDIVIMPVASLESLNQQPPAPDELGGDRDGAGPPQRDPGQAVGSPA